MHNTFAQNMMAMNVMPPGSYSTSASWINTGNSVRYVSMKNYNHVDFIINMGTTSEATAVMYLYQAKAPGTAVANSSISTTALSIGTYWTNKASVNGVFVRTAATAGAIAIDSTNHAIYIAGVDVTQLNAQSSYDCIGIAIGTGTISTTCNLQVTAVLSGARWEKDALLTAKA